MQQKQFMVVLLPKDSENQHFELPNLFTDYNKAFDYLNELVSEEQQQIFKMPKREEPIRVSLSSVDVELWIINRTHDLLTQ